MPTDTIKIQRTTRLKDLLDKMRGKWAGPHNVIWEKNAAHIAEIIKRYSLTPMSKEQMEKLKPTKTAPATVLDFKHGIPADRHVHYMGKVYLLNEKQWKDFVGPILKDFSEKLARTSTISLENLNIVSGVMEETRR